MLEIIEAANFYEGNPSMELNYEGFDIPEADENPELKIFNTKTFYSFVKYHSTEAAYRPVNNFLRTLSIEDQKEIASTLMVLNGLIKQPITNLAALTDLTQVCAEIIADLDTEISLCKKINEYTYYAIRSGDIPITDMSDAGSRPQDRKEMTFYQNEAETLTAIAVLAKLMSPVTGEFIGRHAVLVPQQMRESFCCSLFTRLYNRHYQEIIKKITFYVSTLVHPKSRNDPAIHYRGFTPSLTTRVVTDMILTKKLVSIDLFKPDGSVIKYIASCIRSYLDSQQKNTPGNWNIKIFTDPKDGSDANGNEETNNSRIEIESTYSKKPAVTEPLVRFTAQWIVNKYLSDGLVNGNVFMDSLHWYHDNPVLITPIGMFIIATYFGPDLAGGKSVYQLDGKEMVGLVTLLQCIAAENGMGCLANSLTMAMSAEERVASSEDFNFANTWRSSSEYSSCRKVVSGGFGEVNWDTELKEIVRLLTTKTFKYHTAPAIWDVLDLRNLNASVFTDYYGLTNELLLLIKDLWELRCPKEGAFL